MVQHSIANQETNGEESTALQQRIERGIQLYADHGASIEWVGEDRCRVPSSKYSDRFYLVVFSEDGERCNCVDFSRNSCGGVCKHTVAALISWAKLPSYRVEKRHDSRLSEYVPGGYVWDVVRVTAGVSQRLQTFWSIADAYKAKWLLDREGVA